MSDMTPEALPVVVFMGQQGSGKSTVAEKFKQSLTEMNIPFKESGIKDTFRQIADGVISHFEGMGYAISNAAMKEALLMVSTFGEMHIDRMIWSNRYLETLSENRHVAIASDIRTQMNLDVLKVASENRKVILFNLVAPEEVRKARIPDTWRDNAGYTEVPLQRDQISGDSVFWFDIDATRCENEVVQDVINNFVSVWWKPGNTD